MNRRQTMRNWNGSNRPNSPPKHEWRDAPLRQQRIYANSSGDSLKRQFKLCFAFHSSSSRFTARNITLLAEKNVLYTRFIAISLISNGLVFFWTYKEIRLRKNIFLPLDTGNLCKRGPPHPMLSWLDLFRFECNFLKLFLWLVYFTAVTVIRI